MLLAAHAEKIRFAVFLCVCVCVCVFCGVTHDFGVKEHSNRDLSPIKVRPLASLQSELHRNKHILGSRLPAPTVQTPFLALRSIPEAQAWRFQEKSDAILGTQGYGDCKRIPALLKIHLEGYTSQSTSFMETITLQTQSFVLCPDDGSARAFNVYSTKKYREHAIKKQLSNP